MIVRLQQFFSDIQRIREALERISPPNPPPDPRRKPVDPYGPR